MPLPALPASQPLPKLTRECPELPAPALLQRVPPCEPPFERAGTTRAAATAARPRTLPRRTAPLHRPAPVEPAALVRAQQVFRTMLEVLEGRRGPQQLQPLMTQDLVARVTVLARARLARRPAGPARLNRVHVQQVLPHVAESCATVTLGARVHAVAARLELDAQGWRCTALRLG